MIEVLQGESLEIIAELQFAFVCFLIGQVSCFVLKYKRNKKI